MAKARGAIILLVALLAVIPAPAASAAERQTIGYLEMVRIYPGEITLRAKIDSGAATSSIDVGKIEEFDHGGEPWVRFRLAYGGGEGLLVERPLVRIANVQRSGTPVQNRYVIKLGICLGGYYKEGQVNLSDRTGMSYRILIGRRFLEDRFLIDTSAKHLTKPECPEAPKAEAPKR